MSAGSRKTKGARVSKEKLVAVGRVGKLFGTDGGVTLNLYDTFPGVAKNEEPLWVIIDSLAVPLFAEQFERRGKNGALVRFADIDTPERATEMLGREVLMKVVESVKPRKRSGDELYIEDLEGFVAIMREQGSSKELRGDIAAYIDSELNPLFEVVVDGSEILIPASEEFIEEVDPNAREVIFILPEGLLELYI